MTAPLKDTLRYIDLTFDLVEKARAILVDRGEVYKTKPCGWDASFDPECRRQGKLIGDLAAKLIGEAVFTEQLDPVVIADGRARARYNELTGAAA